MIDDSEVILHASPSPADGTVDAVIIQRRLPGTGKFFVPIERPLLQLSQLEELAVQIISRVNLLYAFHIVIISVSDLTRSEANPWISMIHS